MQEPTISEKGYPPPPPPPVGEFTPSLSHFVTPDYQRYLYQQNFISRTYFWTHDEALRSAQCNTEAMWADAVINSAIRDRQRPVVQLEWQLQPRDWSNPREKKLAQTLTGVLEDIPDFQQLRRCLMDALWWGRAGVELAYDWDFSHTGEKRMIVRDWTQVHGDSLVFKWGGGLGYMVSTLMAGQEGVYPIEGRGGYARFLTPDQEQCLLVHKFEPMASEFFRPEMAGSIKGTGYRGRVYWYWWLKHNLMRIMFDFLRKVGNGFFLAGYMAGNENEYNNIRTALEEQEGQPVIYVPLSQGRTLDEVLKHLPSNMQGADFQWSVIQAMNQIIRQTILGEDGTTRSMPAGLGDGQSTNHGLTADERVKYDSQDLETPLQKLVNVLARYTDPTVRPPKFCHLADKREPGEIMQSAMWFTQMGGTIAESWARDQLGIPEPKPGETTLGQVQMQQAAALNAAPAGVPIQGQPGPVDSGAPAGVPPGPDAAGAPPAQPAQPGLDPNLLAQIQPMKV